MTLFDGRAKLDQVRARARRDAPDSATKAAELADRKIGKQLLYVLDLVRRWPGRTSLELAAQDDTDRYMIARRLADLEKHGYVRKAGKRECRIGGRPSQTWEAI